MPYALITGASKGIGKAIAMELARRGYDLLIISRTESLLKLIASEINQLYHVKVDWLAADLSHPDTPQKILTWCKNKNYEVEVLVNNAGYGLSGPLNDHSIEENADMMQVNMTNVVAMCQLFIPMLRGNKGKSYILNIGSTSAYQALPGMGLYAATKVFILRFSRALHYELRKSNVSVSCACPGPTDTDFVNRAGLRPNALKAAKKMNMSPGKVAAIAVSGMLAGKAEVITGTLNKLGAFGSWLLPKSIVERIGARIYEQ